MIVIKVSIFVRFSLLVMFSSTSLVNSTCIALIAVLVVSTMVRSLEHFYRVSCTFAVQTS